MRSSWAFLIATMFFVMLTACSNVPPVVTRDKEIPTPEIIDRADKISSRTRASHSLTQDGYKLLIKKDYDGAIRVLERAVGISPSDGPGYYYLAEAWLGKKNHKLATQFNKLALLYLRADLSWIDRAEQQKKRIKNDQNDI